MSTADEESTISDASGGPVGQRISLFVPTIRNDGVPVPRRSISAYEKEILRFANGYTRTRAVGAWRSQTGEVYVNEPLWRYDVDVEAGAGLEEALIHVDELRERIRRELGEKLIYVTVSSVGFLTIEAYA